MSVHEALDQLATARGRQAMVDGVRQVQREVRQARRQASKTWGALAQTYGEAMRIWDEQKAAGIPITSRLAGLEQTLRAAWPQMRPWKYVCQDCGDYGLRMGVCPGDATCGRDKEHYAHDFGMPCWCSTGARFKGKAKPSAEDYTAAGKSPKPQKLGRW